MGKDRKMIVPIIEEMLKLPIDRKSVAKISALSQSTTRAFKASQEVKKPKERCSSSKGETKDCINYLSNRHNSSSCWYICHKLALKSFHERYISIEQCYEALEKFQTKMVKWKKTNPKKGMIANICAKVLATGKKKNYQQY